MFPRRYDHRHTRARYRYVFRGFVFVCVVLCRARPCLVVLCLVVGCWGVGLFSGFCIVNASTKSSGFGVGGFGVGKSFGVLVPVD